MDGIVAYILSKKFTKDTVIGMGAIKGAACQVQSINKVGKTTTITLKWEDNVGTSHTQSFDVEDGLDGVSVQSATIDNKGHLKLTLSDGTVLDCGQVLPQYDTMPTPSASNVGQILQYIGATTSNYTNGYFYQCINDGGVYKWVAKSVQNSYDKSETYNKIEIGDITNLPDNTKNVVENIGSLKLSIDQLQASKLSKSDIDDALSDVSENPVQNKVITLAINQLQGSVLNKEDRFRVTLLPLGSDDLVGKIVQYIGENTGSLTKGYFYQCVKVSEGVYNWVQKNVQPSSGGTGGDGVVDGYYNSTDHLFYEEAAYTNPITGEDNTLYVSLDTNLLYRYNGSIFIRVDESGSGENDVINGYYNVTDGKFYEDSTYTTEITGEVGKIYISIDTNIQYRWDDISVPNKFVTISSSIDIDDELSTTSENPVQNKKITIPLQALQGSVLTKMQKVLSAQLDNFAVFDNNGQVIDSNISKDIVPNNASSSNKLITKDDVKPYTGSDGINVNSSTNNITLDISYLTASRIGYIPTTEKGSANGVAELNSTGKIPSSQLPSYVDDVIDGYLYDATHFYKEEVIGGYYNTIDGNFYNDSAYTELITPVIGKFYLDKNTGNTYQWDSGSAAYVVATPTRILGEDGKIYISIDTDIQYRWTGTSFSALGGALQLGETSSTAYRGDRGKTAYDHSQITNGSNPHNTTANNINLATAISVDGVTQTEVESALGAINTLSANNKSNKADKVSSATNGDLAGLDANGNLTDSGILASKVIQKVTTATGLLKDDGTVDTTNYAPSNKAYLIDDITENTIDNADYFPFYDSSANGKRKTLWSNIKEKLTLQWGNPYT